MAILKSKQARAGHAAGIFSDMTLDGPPIGTLVAVVDRAKNLPNRKTIGKQDPYCAMRLAKEAKKTDTDRRGGQTPKWDQELRFDVHDSPDYYKLKCSIFNDDKKTELIGEAWIDLDDVIKLGGGQSDSWHQLNFKGKYAGDIRMELTYYDTREQPQEKKRSKEKSLQSTESVSGSDLSQSASRSLGPREIKRRPLPQSPAGSLPVHSSPAPVEQAAPQRPPKGPYDEPQHHLQQPLHAPVPTRPRRRSASPLPPAPPQEQYYDEPEQYEQVQVDNDQHEYQQRHQRAQSMPVEQYQQPWQYPLGRQHRDYQPESQQQYITGPERPREDYSDYSPAPQSAAPTYPDEDEIWQHHQRPQSVHMHSDPVTPQHSSPAHRPVPTSTHSDSQLVQYHQQRRLEPTPTRSVAFADSPLRHSMSQQDVYPQPPQADAPPPLPPKHRDTPPRRPRNDYPPSAYLPQPLRIGQKRSSVHDRSPLQSLEDVYDVQQQDNIPPPHTPQSQPQFHRHSMYTPTSQPQGAPQQQLELYSRRNSYDMQPHFTEPEPSQQRPVQRSRQNSYEIRHPSISQQMVEGPPQPFVPQDLYHHGYDDALQPTVEDAPPSPGLQPAVARKAVGASPKKLNTVPFGPDSYDVLNPGSSPVTNERTQFETQEQAKESHRLREVEKLRDLGPIIGNDGREIDPSDHLPADTWAPEPERKNRKPEHVIHIRSKNDANRPLGARASPIVIRHHGNSTSALSSPVPVTPPASSPVARNTPHSFMRGRNRLQKPMPASARPLPTQPYASPTAAAAASSPALASSPHQMHDDHQQPRQLQSRRPSYDNRIPSHLSRPPLSEYQVPVGNAYTPRSSSRNNYNPQKQEYTPTKQPSQAYTTYSSPAQHDTRDYDRRNSYDGRDHERRNSYDQRSDYSYENHVSYEPVPVSLPQQQQQQQPPQHYDDPLAAEMSLIDIGPSRSSYGQGSIGRSMVRRW